MLIVLTSTPARSNRGVLRKVSLKRLACACVHGRSRGMSANAHEAAASKVVHLLRHGQTEMNAFLEKHESAAQRSSSPDFDDPLL